MDKNITLTIKDSQDLVTFDLLEVPLKQNIIAGKTDIMTIDGNITTYHSFTKRSWSHKWGYMSSKQYDRLKDFYDRQNTSSNRPLITIKRDGVIDVVDVPVVFELSDKEIISNCGMVKDVEIKMRETK